MRNVLLVILLFLLTGCAPKELNKRMVADMVIDYYMPYSSTNILVPQEVHVLSLKKLSQNKAIAHVCYTFRFLTSYQDLVRYIKQHPKSFLARFDVGLVSLLGRKFGNFQKNDVLDTCDDVIFVKKYEKWSIEKI